MKFIIAIVIGLTLPIVAFIGNGCREYDPYNPNDYNNPANYYYNPNAYHGPDILFTYQEMKELLSPNGICIDGKYYTVGDDQNVSDNLIRTFYERKLPPDYLK